MHRLGPDEVDDVGHHACQRPRAQRRQRVVQRLHDLLGAGTRRVDRPRAAPGAGTARVAEGAAQARYPRRQQCVELVARRRELVQLAQQLLDLGSHPVSDRHLACVALEQVPTKRFDIERGASVRR
jgi:hypothetical protein